MLLSGRLKGWELTLLQPNAKESYKVCCRESAEVKGEHSSR